jgi:hypothetical protein
VTVAACMTLLVVPLVPGALRAGTPAALLGLPAESIAVVLVLVVIDRRWVRAVVAGAFGVLVVAGIAVGALDTGFRATIDRPFDPAQDGGAVVNAWGVVADAASTATAVLIVVLLLAVAVAGAILLSRAALRVGRTIRNEGRRGRIALVTVTAAWVLGSVAGLHVLPGAPVAASGAVETIVDASARTAASIEGQREFERAVDVDPLDGMQPAALLSGLAGKDVVVAFVESYGKVAVQDAAFTHSVAKALEDGQGVLDRDGYSARSAFLTSPTFGGVSWLAHSTLQSGVWVDSQTKYDRLVVGDRLTLTRAFDEAGWRTVAIVPSNKRAWQAGTSFFGFDDVLDSRNMGYRGPAFGYARMPDQYTWKLFYDRELGARHPPVMAEMDLVSSHTPWTPLPSLVPWDEVGNGSVFDPQPAQGLSAAVAWTDPKRVQALYGQSVEYSLDTVFSFLDTYDQPDLVLVLLGDHQPARIVSGAAADHDVPITIIAKDPAVFDSISSWGWEDGVRPSAAAPVWRMDQFRDRFVAAFSW